MFTKEISRATITNEVADRLFHNIYAPVFSTDRSFAATLRALLHRRLPEGATLRVSAIPLRYSGENLSGMTADAFMKAFTNDRFNYISIAGSFVNIFYSFDKEAGKRILEIIRGSAGAGKKYLDTFERKDELPVFYNKMLSGLFYVDEQAKEALIILDCFDIKMFHALQMMIPKYLPWLFAGSPLAPEETALLKSLGNKSSDEYERLIEGFAQELDMRGEIIRSRLAGFETAFEKIKIDEVTKTIADNENNYRKYLDCLRSILNTIEEQQILLAGLKCKINERGGNDSELMEYFLCNKQLSVIKVTGTEIEFVAHGYADIYDEEAFETYVKNKAGFLYQDIADDVTEEQMEKLYRAIFSSGKLKLRLCAAYRVDLHNGVKPVDDYTFPAESQSYLPNPHIQNMGCIGTYAARFAEYMQKRDYVGAISQAEASARSLNFHDSGVIGELAFELTDTTIRCIENNEGELMTPLEAIKELEVEECQGQ